MEAVAVGVGYRACLGNELLALRDRRALDVLEVMIDDFLSEGSFKSDLQRLGARWPLVAHGTELGIGNANGLNSSYLASVGTALRRLHAWWYSEHLCFLEGEPNTSLGHFAPLDDSEEALQCLRTNGAAVRAATRTPFLLENPADVLGFMTDSPHAGTRLGRAFGAALQSANAGALLDLTNLVLGARNDGYDAEAFLSELPWDRVVEVHLAGGVRDNAGLWIDSHDHDVDLEALALLKSVARKAPFLRAVIIERDDRIPPLERLLSEVEQVRSQLASVGRA